MESPKARLTARAILRKNICSFFLSLCERDFNDATWHIFFNGTRVSVHFVGATAMLSLHRISFVVLCVRTTAVLPPDLEDRFTLLPNSVGRQTYYEKLDFGTSAVPAPGGFDCKIPRPESLSPNATINVSAVLEYADYGASVAIEKSLVYRPEHEWYVLGDCVKLLKRCGRDEDSLAWKYAQRARGKKEDYKLLLDLIETYREAQRVEIPPSDAMVIHLRLGDIIRNSPSTVHHLLVCSGVAGGNHSILKSAFEYLYDAKKVFFPASSSENDAIYNPSVSEEGIPPRRIILVGGSHTKLSPADPSWAYALGIKYTLEAAGYDVTLRLEPRPDDDFVFLSHATIFDQGAGGYSRFAGNMVKLRGGTVIGRRFIEMRGAEGGTPLL